MKKSRFTEEQIAFALKQAEMGTKVDEICRKIGISDATFYKWRQKYGGQTVLLRLLIISRSSSEQLAELIRDDHSRPALAQSSPTSARRLTSVCELRAPDNALKSARQAGKWPGVDVAITESL